MPIVRVCDADGETIIPEGEEVTYAFGLPRVYSPEAEPYVDAYVVALKESARKAQDLFLKHRLKATKIFFKQYPNGKLPDMILEDEYARIADDSMQKLS